MKKLETAYYENASALYSDKANFTTFTDLATSTTLTAMENGSTHVKIGVKKYYRIGKIQFAEKVFDGFKYPVALFNSDFIINWRLCLANLIGDTDKVDYYDVIVEHFTREA